MDAKNPVRVDKHSAEQDLLNRSFDTTAETLVFQLVGSQDGVHYYKAQVGPDGQLGIKDPTNKLVPYAYDSVQLSSYDANGNPGTAQFYQGGLTGTLIATLTMTYDTSGNLLTAVRS